MDRLFRLQKKTAAQALAALNTARRRKNIAPLSICTVYRYKGGTTHRRNAIEKRGRKRALSNRDAKALDQARLRLIRGANNSKRVTWSDVVAEAGYAGKVSVRTCADALRQKDVRYRPPRRKVFVSDSDAKARLVFAKKWAARPASHWAEKVHAYVDNKTFALPLTAQQRLRYQQTMITGHLRKPGEGVDRGFTKPREKHSFLGLPAVTITAAVGKGRVLLWHEISGKWNGIAAATMYQDHLRPALVRAWGALPKYAIVEDGDRTGNQSNRGVEAKKRAKLDALTLPPRTPSLMPLDYAIWHRIIQTVMKEAPAGTETKAAYLARLRTAAQRLPRAFVQGVVGRMHGNLEALVASKGYAPKND